MFSFTKIRLLLLSCLTLLVGLSLSVAPALADGNVLRSFDAPKVFPLAAATYYPIGVTSDGTNLYYSQPANSPGAIFYITPTGTLIRTLLSVPNAGALAWDGSNLWVGLFARRDGATCASGVSGCALLYKVDPSTGNVLKTVDISQIFAADQECNVIDGLSFDPSSGTLWVSPDVGCAFAFTNNVCSIGFAYNIDTSGNLIQRLQFSFGVSGVAVAAKHLYVVDRCPDFTFDQVNSNGNVVSSSPLVKIDPGNWAESIAFDPVSFAPNCALWAVQPYNIPHTAFAADLVAYQIGCT
jgi:hypothetical protein